MKQLLNVITSDAINRYRDKFTVGALVHNIHEECLLGIPNLVAHDHSRPMGWLFPFAVHIEPGLSRAVAVNNLPESAEDRERLIKQYKYYYAKRIIEPNESSINQLKQLLHKHLDGNEKVTAIECIALVEAGLAIRALPQIFSKRDDDGLISLNLLKPLGIGTFQIGEFVLFAHHYLRRNLYHLNTLNYPFLKQLQKVGKNNPSTKIALDPDMVGLASTYTYNGERQELLYWWGPKFSDNLTSIEGGVTHHEANDTEKICYGISGTQFHWGIQAGQRIFEAEELRDLPSVTESQDDFGCRYVHSIVDKTRGLITHFDGAIRIYSGNEMLQRLDVNLDRASKNTRYTKLWRIDGSTDVITWKELLNDYYRDNRQVGEYLGAEDNLTDGLQILQNSEESSLSKQYTPYSMSEGMGVRVALSYRPIHDLEFEDEFTVFPIDTISDGHNSYPYIESEGIELRKILAKLGVNLNIPGGTHFVNFQDLYTNLPLIHIGGTHPLKYLHLSIKAVKMLINLWFRQRQDRVACFRICFPIGELRIITISVLGHVADLNKWFSHNLCIPPTNHEDMRNWADEVSNYLGRVFSTTADTPYLTETLMTTGVLFIDRKRIDFSNYHIEYDDKLKKHIFTLPIPKERLELAKALENIGIIPGLGFLVEESQCTKCQNTYEVCNCSKLLDKSVTREIVQAKPLFPFWTDRPIWD